MFLFGKERKEYRLQKRKARRAFRAYARNGWESPWMKKNSLKEILWK